MFFGFGSIISCTFGKKNGRVAEVRLEKTMGTFWEQCFFLKKFFFFILWAKNVEKMAKYFVAFYKLHLTWPEELFRENYLRFNELFYLFLTFCKNNSERFSKLLSMSPEDSFEKKFFFQKMCFFSRILGLRAFSFKTSGQKNSCDVSKLHPTCPKNRYFEEEQFLEKPIPFLFLFGPWNKMFLTFVEKIAAGLPNLHSSSPRELFDENKALKRQKCFRLFQTLSEKLTDVGKTFFGCVLLPAYYIPKKNLDFFPEVRGPTLTNLDFLKKSLDDFSKLHSIGPRGSS